MSCIAWAAIGPSMTPDVVHFLFLSCMTWLVCPIDEADTVNSIEWVVKMETNWTFTRKLKENLT